VLPQNARLVRGFTLKLGLFVILFFVSLIFDMFRIGSFKSVVTGFKKFAFTSCDAEDDDDDDTFDSFIEKVCSSFFLSI
jgi:hypothetical protein